VSDEKGLKSYILYLLQIHPVVTSKFLPLFFPRCTLVVHFLLLLIPVRKTADIVYQ